MEGEQPLPAPRHLFARMGRSPQPAPGSRGHLCHPRVITAAESLEAARAAASPTVFLSRQSS